MGGWAIYAIVLLIVVVAAFLFSRRATSRKASDAQVIEQLTKGGSNLTRPHNVQFRFYFPSRLSADRVTGTLRADGFQVSVEEVAQGNQYIVRVARSMVPLLSPIGRVAFMTAGAQRWSSRMQFSPTLQPGRRLAPATRE